MVQESPGVRGALNFQQAMASQLMQKSLQGRLQALTPSSVVDADSLSRAAGKGLHLDITV
jgi:hypothetical protein